MDTGWLLASLASLSLHSACPARHVFHWRKEAALVQFSGRVSAIQVLDGCVPGVSRLILPPLALHPLLP